MRLIKLIIFSYHYNKYRVKSLHGTMYVCNSCNLVKKEHVTCILTMRSAESLLYELNLNTEHVSTYLSPVCPFKKVLFSSLLT